MSNFTRRSLPALLASATGLISTALTASPGIDPVYAALEAVAEADKEFSQRLAVHEKAEDRFFSERERLAIPSHEGTQLRTHEAVDRHVNRLSMPLEVQARLQRAFERRSDAKAARYEMTLEDFQTARDLDALRERLHGDVGAYDATCEQIRKTTGLESADIAQGQACNIRQQLLKAALTTIPTTQAGAAALVMFAMAEAKENDECAAKALPAIAAFLSREA